MNVSTVLKQEGDALFEQKEYSEAYDKYTEAINIDAENAVLFSNRSACSFALGRYFDASSDARKATQLDPNYVKAWGRRATADQELGLWDGVVASYEKALELLSQKTELSSLEKGQKGTYERNLEIAKKKMEPILLGGKFSSKDVEGQRPWDRAKPIVEPYKTGEKSGTIGEEGLSSAHIIYEAYLEFSEANNNIESIKLEPEGNQVFITGSGPALERLSNAILRDRRVFHIGDATWFEKYHAQVSMETEGVNAWAEAGPDAVLKEAQDRIQTEGWDKTRPAIAITVRAWILKGFITDCVYENPSAATNFFMNAIDLLSRGRKLWADVPRVERGTVFEETFIMGVRLLHLTTFLSASAKLGKEDKRYSVDTLETLASTMVQDVLDLSNRLDSTFPDQGFLLSFVYYPLAEAYSALGYCFKKKAVFDDKTPEEQAGYFGSSAKSYMKAAQAFPEDDEYHCQHLMYTASSWWEFDDIPIRLVRSALVQLKKAMPKMLAIWENSSIGLGGFKEKLDNYVEQYEAVEAKIQAGELTEDQPWPQDLRVKLGFN